MRACDDTTYLEDECSLNTKCGHALKQQTWRMDAVSEHSTMKVDSPAMMRSEAPSLVKILSANDRRQEAAGTQQPIWARTTARQVALSRVLLPPIFGPVSNKVLACLQVREICYQCPEQGIVASSIQHMMTQ